MLDRLSLIVPGPVLDSTRIYLRPPQLSDWTNWARLRAESRDFLTPWEPTWPADALSRSAFRRRMKRYAQDARDDAGYAFFLFDREAGNLLGGITLSNLRRGVTQACATGYWVGKPYARCGYMHEALCAMIPWVFGELGMHRLEAACLPQNQPSQDLLRKCGFTEEGYAREYLCINGAWRDHLLFALLKSDPRPTYPAKPGQPKQP
ncbi:MAG: GNAT family N-acetyltransferase [Minwuiales bacterium]|nr:GNAT family N-acetyltransferase [Minwuiales bacterium]